MTQHFTEENNELTRGRGRTSRPQAGRPPCAAVQAGARARSPDNAERAPVSSEAAWPPPGDTDTPRGPALSSRHHQAGGGGATPGRTSHLLSATLDVLFGLSLNYSWLTCGKAQKMELADSLGVSWTQCARASSLPKSDSRAKCPPDLSSKKVLITQSSALYLPKGLTVLPTGLQHGKES